MNNETIVSTLSSHGERLKALEKYQKNQNGHIKEVRDDVKSLKYWIMGSMVTIIVLFGGILLKG